MLHAGVEREGGRETWMEGWKEGGSQARRHGRRDRRREGGGVYQGQREEVPHWGERTLMANYSAEGQATNTINFMS